VESHWAARAILGGDTKHDLTKAVFEKAQTMFNTWKHDREFKDAEDAPCGVNANQPSLVKGDGLWEPKGCLYDKGVRRTTVTKMREMDKKGESIYEDFGARASPTGCPRFTRVRVYMKNPKIAATNVEMKSFLDAMFAADVAEACRNVPGPVAGQTKLGAFKDFVGRFAIVGKTDKNEFWDTSRNGMIKGIIEYSLHFKDANIGVFDPLTGTAKAAKKPEDRQPTSKRKQNTLEVQALLFGSSNSDAEPGPANAPAVADGDVPEDPDEARFPLTCVRCSTVRLVTFARQKTFLKSGKFTCRNVFVDCVGGLKRRRGSD